MEDNEAANLLMTDPDLLSDYVNEFFGPGGPYPEELPEDRLAADVASYGDQGYQPPMPRTQAEPVGYQRPQFDMPAPGGQGGFAGDVFAQLDQVPPHERWKVLATAPAQALRSKALISDQPMF